MRFFLSLLIVCSLGAGGYYFYLDQTRLQRENEVLQKTVELLAADSRLAEVIVVEQNRDPISQLTPTTIKFVEYSVQGYPLTPQYFTFRDNLIQFQSLVVRFEDEYVKAEHSFKGKSLSLFWKAFYLDGDQTQEFYIHQLDSLATGYTSVNTDLPFEQELWREFWRLATDDDFAIKHGVKNVQVEAPGVRFQKGMVYTLKIEHDGGIRIDQEPIPQILQGEIFSQFIFSSFW